MGLATARAFAEAGAAVALADVQGDAVRLAAQELVSAGRRAIAVHCNVADETEVAEMVEETVSPSDGWTRRSTTPACSLLQWKLRMRAAKNSIA